MSEQTARLVYRLRARLRRAVRRVTHADLAFGAGVALGTAASLWLLATLLEASLWLAPTVRLSLLVGGATLCTGVAAVLLGRPVGRLLGLSSGPSEEDVARTVGEHYPEVDDRLVNLLQLAKGEGSRAPAPLVDHAVQELADDLESVSFEAIEDFGRAHRAFRAASIPIVGMLAFVLIAPSTFLGASERLLAPGTEFSRPAPFELTVSPGDVQLVTGDTLAVSVRATGDVPTTATLLLRDSTGSTDRVALEANDGRFEHAVPNVRQPLRYRIAAAPVRTDWYTVDVAARPLVRNLQLTLRPPAYTGQAARTLDANVGDVTALPGTRVEVSAALDGPPVASAVLAFESDRIDSLQVNDGAATGTFTVRRDDTYRLRLRSRDGIPNRPPIPYDIDTRTDAPPSISFVAPESPASLEPDLTQSLRLRLGDDFGFERLALFYRVVDKRFGREQAEFDSIDLPLSNPDQTSQTVTYEWLLAQDTGLDPGPGDEIAYYVTVWDNDTVNGPKSAQTRTQRLRMPSRSDQYDQLDETAKATEQQIDSLRDQSATVREQFQRLRRELRRTREADWQAQRRLDQLQRQQDSVREEANTLSRQLDKMTRQMERDNLSSPETTEQFKELQRIAEEMSSSDLQQALQQLRKAMEQDTPRRMQEALDEVYRRQEQRQQQLERTKELFERLQAQQQLEEMRDRTQTLKETQETLEEETTERMADSSESATDREGHGDPSDDDSETERPESDASSADSTAAPDAPSPPSDSSSQNDASSPQEQGEAGANEDLAEEQDRAAEEMEALMKQMREAREQMGNLQSAPSEQLQKMNEQLRQEDLPEQMRQNSRQLRQNQLDEARRGQQQMQRQLQNMQQRLNQMQEQMKSQQQRMNVSGLRTLFEHTLHLSEEQEALRTTLSDLAEEGPVLRDYAREQNALLNGLQTVTDSLESIAQRVPAMSQTVQEETGRARRAMESALSALEEREADRAVGRQKSSMMHLNELALLLSDLLDSMQQQSMAQGMSAQQMMKQLQQMSGQQQKLNQQVQQHLNETQGERLSRDQGERRRELAEQQRQLQEQLQDMEVGSEAEDQILGDLDRIAEQMDEAAEALENNPNRRDEIRQRQQKILTRLLNAQQSLRTQGKQDQRRGEAADAPPQRRSPDALPDFDDVDRLRQDLIRALEMGYTADYEELIRRYFELLQEDSPPAPSPKD